MYFNKTICDLYIGTGAGEKLMEDIDRAKRSVKIVSPYLSPFLVNTLIELHYRHIDVRLVTMDSLKDYDGAGRRILTKLIQQDRSIDPEREALRSKRIRRRGLLRYLFVIIALLIGAMTIWMRESRVLLGLFVLPPILLMIWNYTSKIRNTAIYRYSYRQLFPFKVCATPDYSSNSHPYIHGKMYLIDDEIAYLGSLNLTANGTKNNYETRIRIIDPGAVGELAEEFDTLLNNVNIPGLDVTEWGKELYRDSRK
jgi:phosphatidylserine/phosphatidylglycerophosphate/cardiolipin synthase-like enzyme